MQSNSHAALAHVYKDEGGYAEREEEGGGAVNRGITFTVFKAWRLSNGKPMPTWADLKAMPEAEADQIYRAQYLTGIHFDDLPVGVDYVVLDAAITGGVTGGVKVLQKALGLKPVDGHYGLVTRWAAQHRDVVALIHAVCDVRLATYKIFKIFNKQVEVDRKGKKVLLTNKDGSPKTWGNIWTDRISEVRNRALVMTQAPTQVPIATAPAQPILEAPKFPSPKLPPLKFNVVKPPPLKGKWPVSTDLTKGMVRVAFTPDEFLAYLNKTVAPKMGTWRPEGIVLHNTGKMKFPATVTHKATGKTEVLTGEQQLDNMSVDWVNRGKFKSAPHLVITQAGVIWACWPLWQAGTHSPSYNKTHWGIEMVGDFDIEPFPAVMQWAVTTAMAGMFSMLGKTPTNERFRLHKEDPRSTHKRCPGVNSGTKEQWIARISEGMHQMNPSG